MKQLIFYTLGILALLGIAALVIMGTANRNENSASYSASALLASENEFDFGTIAMLDGVVKHRFILSNDNTEPLRIEKIYTSCMCTSAVVIDASGKTRGKFGMPGHSAPSGTNVTVEPGESIAVEAEFDPAAHGPSGVGLAERSIYIETNSQKSPKVELRFTAVVTR